MAEPLPKILAGEPRPSWPRKLRAGVHHGIGARGAGAGVDAVRELEKYHQDLDNYLRRLSALLTPNTLIRTINAGSEPITGGTGGVTGGGLVGAIYLDCWLKITGDSNTPTVVDARDWRGRVIETSMFYSYATVAGAANDFSGALAVFTQWVGTAPAADVPLDIVGVGPDAQLLLDKDNGNLFITTTGTTTEWQVRIVARGSPVLSTNSLSQT